MVVNLARVFTKLNPEQNLFVEGDLEDYLIFVILIVIYSYVPLQWYVG